MVHFNTISLKHILILSNYLFYCGTLNKRHLLILGCPDHNKHLLIFSFTYAHNKQSLIQKCTHAIYYIYNSLYLTNRTSDATLYQLCVSCTHNHYDYITCTACSYLVVWRETQCSHTIITCNQSAANACSRCDSICDWFAEIIAEYKQCARKRALTVCARDITAGRRCVCVFMRSCSVCVVVVVGQRFASCTCIMLISCLHWRAHSAHHLTLKRHH